MDDETRNKLDEFARKLEEVRHSVEQIKKYFLWMLVISIIFVVLPLVGLMFAIPNFLNIYGSLI